MNQTDENAEGLEDPPEGATPVCPHCMEPVSELDNFCPKCLGPITAHASIGPMEQVFSYGRMCQRAMSGKPKFVAVLGMWLIFGPQISLIVLVLALAASGRIDSDGLVWDLIKIALIIGLLVLYSAILWKVTRRYVRHGTNADN